VKPVPKNFQSSGGTARFRGTVAIDYASDYMIIVEAGPKLSAGTPASPPVVGVVEPEVVPIAFTNPVFVDVDGNGFALSQGTPVRAGAAPGRMTAVTRAARAAAIRRGEHFPLHDFRIDPATVTRPGTAR
jgi:hypothetical protein